MVRLGRLACEQFGDDLRVEHDHGTLLLYSDDVVSIYFHPEGKLELTVYKQPGDDENCILSVTNGEVTELRPDHDVLDHLRRKFLLDALVN